MNYSLNFCHENYSKTSAFVTVPTGVCVLAATMELGVTTVLQIYMQNKKKQKKNTSNTNYVNTVIMSNF